MCEPSPSFMIAPAPNVFSICESALVSAFCSAETVALTSVVPPCFFATALSPFGTADYVLKNSIVPRDLALGQAVVSGIFALDPGNWEGEAPSEPLWVSLVAFLP